MDYEFQKIEEKWRKAWAEKKIYHVTEDSSKPKYYVLNMFPYPRVRDFMWDIPSDI